MKFDDITFSKDLILEKDARLMNSELVEFKYDANLLKFLAAVEI